MAARRLTELGTVPEYGRLSAAHGGETGATDPPGNIALGGHSGGRDGPRGAHPPGAGSGGSGGRDGGFGSGGGSLSRATTNRFPPGVSSRGQTGGALGRTSLVVKLQKLQQSGRQLIDLERLQTNLLNKTIVKQPEAQDYVGEGDQGFMALLARYVDVPPRTWLTLQDTLGSPDGHFWHSGCGPGEVNRNPVPPTNTHEILTISVEANDAAAQQQEEGRARPTQQPREPKPRESKSIFGMPVIQPYSNYAVIWTMIILFLDLTYTAFWVPMNVAFCTSEYGKLSSGCTTSDLVGGALYLLNLLLGFQIGVVATNGIRKRIVGDGRLVAWLYFWHGRFWIDLVASIPLVYLVVVLAGRSQFRLNKGWVNCLSLLRLVRMVRLVSISKVVCMDSLSGRYRDSLAAGWLSVTVLYSIFLAYHLAVALNLAACIMVLCAYFQGYTNSWMTAVSWANVPNASPLYQWYCAVYWMIVTATTTGFGDFQPRSIAEQVVANIAMVGGMIMFGVLVASIGQALSRATREAHQAYSARQKILHVMEWAQHRKLPDEMRKQIQNFFADKYGRKEEGAVDTTMMASLPSGLRAKVASAICCPLLKEVHIMRELPKDVQTLLAENMRPLRLPAGEDLCQQGDVTNCLWILQEGTVEAVRYKEQPVALDAVGGPRLLGESVLLGEAVEAARVRPWTLRTVSPCRLWGITLGELYPLMRMYPIIGATAATYVKDKAVASLPMAEAARPGESGLRSHREKDDHWCEIAAVIVRQLQDLASDEEAEGLRRELQGADGNDGTLTALLEQLLEFCATRRGGPAASAGVFGVPPPGPLCNTAHGRSGIADGPPPTTAPPGGPAAADGVCGEPQPLPSPEHQGTAVAVAVAGHTAFGTPAAAATMSAVLTAASPLGPQPDLPAPGLLQLHNGSGGGGHAASARPSPQLAGTTPIPPGRLVSSGGGGAAAAAVVQCPGCQRCICPSCGQGMVTAGPAPAAAVPPLSMSGGGGAAAGPAAAAAAAAAAGGVTGVAHLVSAPGGGAGGAGGGRAVNAGAAGAVRPGAMRPWVTMNRGSLRRVSVGLRADSIWASERRSMDRRLAATSIMSMYD